VRVAIVCGGREREGGPPQPPRGFEKVKKTGGGLPTPKYSQIPQTAATASPFPRTHTLDPPLPTHTHPAPCKTHTPGKSWPSGVKRRPRMTAPPLCTERACSDGDGAPSSKSKAAAALLPLPPVPCPGEAPTTSRHAHVSSSSEVEAGR